MSDMESDSSFYKEKNFAQIANSLIVNETKLEELRLAQKGMKNETNPDDLG